MYEIEGLVEYSIKTLDKSQNKNLNKKTLIWNLYNNVQGSFDCSFTHFRVMDILLKNRFTNTINIQEYAIKVFTTLNYKPPPTNN